MTTIQPKTLLKTQWVGDISQSSLTFEIRHLMIAKIKGSFTDFQIFVESAGDDFSTAQILVRVNVTSIKAGNSLRDAELRKFFDASAYPYIIFQSKAIRAISASRFLISGELTIKNITHPIEFEADYQGKWIDPQGNEQARFNLTTKINRLDYDLQWNYAIQDTFAGTEVTINAQVVVGLQSEKVENEPSAEAQSMMAAYYTQQSQLPQISYLHRIFPQSFIYFKPKDLVGGDFYWFDEIENKIVVVVADATGHGMEGSLKAMMGISMLNQIISPETVHHPREILLRLHQAILASVRKSAGMRSSMLAIDAAIVIIDPQKQKINYIGAGIPLYIYKGGELVQVDAYRFSAGSHFHAINDLNSTCFSYQAGDTLFLASDGFKDQYGGGNFKKMGVKRFRALLESAAGQPFDQIPDYIQNEFTTYKGWVDQMDDVTLLSIRF